MHLKQEYLGDAINKCWLSEPWCPTWYHILDYVDCFFSIFELGWKDQDLSHVANSSNVLGGVLDLAWNSVRPAKQDRIKKG